MPELVMRPGISRRASVVALAALLPLSACGPAHPDPSLGPRPGGPEAVPLPTPPGEGVLAAHAELLRLEDRRDADEPTLRRLAADADPAIRARTALALGRLRARASAPLLLALLEDPDTSVAATAAFSLGQLGDSTHAAALAARMSSAAGQAPTVAAEAAYALGKVGGAEAQRALGAHLSSEDPADPSAPLATGSALLAIWRLPRLSSAQPIERWLQATDPELRWRAAYALTRRPDPRALQSLRTALGDADDRVRAMAVRGLTAAAADTARTDPAGLVAALLPLLADPDYEVSINAARVLATHGDARVPPALAAAAGSSRRHLALAAIEGLGRLGVGAAPAGGTLMALALADTTPVALRAAALESLGRVSPAEADRLAATLAVSPEWRLRAAAARVYAGTAGPGGGPARSELRDLLADPDPRVANAALQAVVDAAGDEISGLRTFLIGHLGHADQIVRSTALTALARVPDPASLPALLDAYARAQADTLNDAALAALDAIGAIAQHAVGQGQGAAPTRVFLTRFTRPDDPLLRQRATQRLDSAAVVAAWGAPLPLETGRSLQDYRAVVDRLVAPALAGAPPPIVAIVTAGDSILLRLDPVGAPLTVESFLRLADDGYFDGQEWPRVVPNFVVQGGDPRGDTSGGPGYSIRDEIGRSRYGGGTLGMALAGPDTGGSQFFVTHSPQPHLDGIYAIFGQLVAGDAVVERLLPGDSIATIRSVR